MEELALLDTLDMGGPINRTRNNRQRALGMLRYYAGMATPSMARRSAAPAGRYLLTR
jgi:acyl-CoA reductase-like NAD-dependent aldehyde dehydrogenase